MDTIDYNQKYLKYKKKYLELKAQQESLNQTGGFVYTPGKYLFFIPESKADFDSQIPKEFCQKKLVDADGTIVGSLDSLTNYLGNCTKFLRVGKTSTGFDFANTYNTLYSNQSSTDVSKRETKEAYEKAKPYIESAVKTTKQGAEQIAEQAKKMIEKKQGGNNESSDSTIHASDIISDTEKVKSDKVVMTGGEGECVREPIKLKSNLLISDINDITSDKLTNIVNFIVNQKLQGIKPDNKISRIILVEKPIVPGKLSTIDMERYFIVSYKGNNSVIVSKNLKKIEIN